MKGEIDIGGVFVPCLLMVAVAAFFATAMIKQGLRRTEFYRFVWHPGLFDFAVFVLVAWGIAVATSHVTP